MTEILALLILLTIIALLAIVYLFLAAPDVAIVQIGVEVVSLVILIRATLGREVHQPKTAHAVVGVAFAVAFVAVIGLFGIQVFNQFPAFGIPVMERFADAPTLFYLNNGLVETGAPNLVTAVLLDFRAWDTLGEATVLFCAVLGTVAVLRRNARINPKNTRDESS